MKLPFPYLPVELAGRLGRDQHLPTALLECLGGFAHGFQDLARLGLRYGLVLFLRLCVLLVLLVLVLFLLLLLFLVFLLLLFLLVLLFFLLLIGGNLL